VDTVRFCGLGLFSANYLFEFDSAYEMKYSRFCSGFRVLKLLFRPTVDRLTVYSSQGDTEQKYLFQVY